MGNEIATIEVIFGLMRAGMVAVPINISVSDAAIAAMLNDASVVGLFLTGDQADSGGRHPAGRIGPERRHALRGRCTPFAPAPGMEVL